MATTLVSVDEYLCTSYPDGDCEYVDGEIVERNVGEIDHASLQSRVAVYLLTHYPQFWAAVAVRVQVQSSRIRVPDVTLVAGPRPYSRPYRHPRSCAVQEKIDDYLAFGIPYVWVVNPRTGRGYVHTTEAAREAKDGILRTADPATELPLYELLGK
jgi:Uma2 family endonuclease